ncbi:hypothetical protein HMSSN036_94940 [Paenibacillus macerans]|nr:hypothetical protein HMSSN036_94940 [Paenibacillus macerans]
MPGRQTKERALEETPPREAKPGTTERRILMITRIIRLIPERWGRAREMGPALKIRLAKARPIPAPTTAKTWIRPRPPIRTAPPF